MIADRRLDRLIQITIPIVATAGLGLSVLVAVPPATTPTAPNGAIDVDPGDVVAAGVLPVSDVDRIVATASSATGVAPVCSGPWATGRILNWACRTPDALVILRGRSRTAIEELDMTWFGFDPARSSLDAWAAAAALNAADINSVVSWARTTAGTDAATTVGGLRLIAGASRGALSLVVAGRPCDVNADADRQPVAC